MNIIKDYSKYFHTIRELSWDERNHVSLIEDDDEHHRMIDFDEIKREICKSFRGEENSSCDAYLKKDGKRYLVEFKNQSEGNIKRAKLRNKAYDSITLLMMNENVTREELRENTVLIVVYDNKKHVLDSESYNSSESMDGITQTLKKLAKRPGADKPLVKFQMEKYIGSLYQDVHTLQVEDFKRIFYPVLFDESSEPIG